VQKRFIEGDLDILIISLRSGAGLDGLQGSCSVVVFGELDWSPAVHEQAIGRIHRDGQENSVVAYFLMAEDGADPVIAETLGLKREQMEGIRDPSKGDILEKVDTSGDRVRRLAAAYLNKGSTKNVEARKPVR